MLFTGTTRATCRTFRDLLLRLCHERQVALAILRLLKAAELHICLCKPNVQEKVFQPKPSTLRQQWLAQDLWTAVLAVWAFKSWTDTRSTFVKYERGSMSEQSQGRGFTGLKGSGAVFAAKAWLAARKTRAVAASHPARPFDILPGEDGGMNFIH